MWRVARFVLPFLPEITSIELLSIVNCGSSVNSVAKEGNEPPADVNEAEAFESWVVSLAGGERAQR
jgi:hypothetical protein